MHARYANVRNKQKYKANFTAYTKNNTPQTAYLLNNYYTQNVLTN